MDNVWIHTKGEIWDPIIEELQNQGYWGTVIKRTRKPSIEEFKEIRNSFELPEAATRKQYLFYEILARKMHGLLGMLSRKTDWGTDRYNSASVHELSNRIKIYADFYTTYLLKEDIGLVIFWISPHMGWDNILYEVAKFYGIKTLILDQSHFPNKFFHYFDFNDYGLFSTSKILGNITEYKIEKSIEKDWFYMRKNQWRIADFNFKKLFSISKYKNRINRIFEKNDYLRLLKEFSLKERRSQSFFRFYTERNYKKELKNIIKTQYSLENKYVYFPLHRAPEKSTSNWSGIYLDQVLALEKLSKLIPSDWFIYIKENPGQTGASRDHLFFERLKLIPNLVFLSSDANTFELTRNAQFIATIVGTVGFEAITGGKNILIFGWGVWYKTLPGVYEYRDDININELVDKKIDHALLEKKIGMLINKCGTGIIYDAWLPSLETFSVEENTRTVVESLKRILY